MTMQAFQVTATLTSPLAIPLFPVALDALLAASLCSQLGLIAGVGEWQDLEVPLMRSECGRFHLASVGHYKPIAHAAGNVTKRAPVDAIMRFGEAKIRSVDTSTGRNKSFRIPQPRAICTEMRWWAIGDIEQVEPLLRLVTHVGKKRSVGHGRVARWEVSPCATWPGFPILRPDGTPMRNLPIDQPGLGPETAIGHGPLSYPYWDQTRAVEVAQPVATDWMGPVPETATPEPKIAGRWFMTPHAVEQFLARFGDGVGARSYQQALAWMIDDSIIATKAHDAKGGGEVWVGRRPWRIRYVVKPALEPGAMPAAVTVLSKDRRSNR